MPEPLNKLINNFVKKLNKTTPDIFQYEGFGNCAYASSLLHDYLKNEKVKNDILIGEFLLPSPAGNKCKEVAISLMNKLPEDNSRYGVIKKGFIKRGFKLLNRIGHAVVVVDSTILDITSGQFGLPNIYSFEEFKEIWKDVYTAEIVLNKNPSCFNVEKIKRLTEPKSYKQESFGFQNWV